SIKSNVSNFSYGASGASVSFTSSEDAALADDDRDRASFIEFKIEDQGGNEIKIHSGGVKGEGVKGLKGFILFFKNKSTNPQLATFKLEEARRDKGDLKREAIEGRLTVVRHSKHDRCWTIALDVATVSIKLATEV